MATRYIVNCVDATISTDSRAWADTMAMAMKQKQMLERLTGKIWHIAKENKPKQ